LPCVSNYSNSKGFILLLDLKTSEAVIHHYAHLTPLTSLFPKTCNPDLAILTSYSDCILF